MTANTNTKKTTAAKATPGNKSPRSLSRPNAGGDKGTLEPDTPAKKAAKATAIEATPGIKSPLQGDRGTLAPGTPAGWPLVTLSSLGTFSKGKGILKEQVKSTGYPCVRYGEIYTTHHFVIRDFASFIDEKTASESKEIRKGDILFAGSGETIEEIGKCVAYVGDARAFAGGDVIVLTTKGTVEVEFLAYMLETDGARQQKRKLGQGQSVVHIYPNDLKQLKIPLPPRPEQTAIANLLSTWDRAITATGALLAQKEQRKKWLMQQLLTGKKRLKGFKGEWKEVRLGEVFRLSSGDTKPNDVSATITSEYQYPIYGGNGIMAYSKEYNSEGAKIVIGRVGEYCGITMKVAGRYWITDNALYTTSFDKNIFIDFLTYKLVYEDLSKLRNKGGQPLVSQKPIYAKQVTMPSLEEQTAIAQVLQAADAELSLLRKKLEQLKEQKKGLMQQLLTGKRRLKM